MNITKRRKFISRRGFTLVEVLVALAVFSLLLVIILVPLNMGFTMLNLGKAQSDVQAATQEVVDRMRIDLSHAVYVFPNGQVSGVTDQTPYMYYDPSTGEAKYYGPYIKLSGVDTILSGDQSAPVCGVASRDAAGVSNLSRLDMLLARTNGTSLLTPLQPSYYIVSYYARRRDVSKPYQPIDNPIVLFRAQIPYYSSDGSGYLMRNGSFNADISNTRYGQSYTSTCTDQGSWWLAESEYGEPNLEYLTQIPSGYTGDDFTLYGSHVSLLPTDMGMVTGVDYRGYDTSTKTFVTTYTPPKSTFICEDTDKDGVVDQVRLTILLQNATPGASATGPQITLPQVVDLPNVRSFAGTH